MYSREKRQKAVELYIKFGKSAAAVIQNWDILTVNLMDVVQETYRGT